MHIQLSGRLGNQLFEIAHGLSIASNQQDSPRFFWDKINYPNGVDDEFFKTEYFKSLNVSFEKNDVLGFSFLVLDKIRSQNNLIEKRICNLLNVKREHNEIDIKKIRLVSGFYQDYQWAEKSYPLMAPLMDGLENNFNEVAKKMGIPSDFQCIHFRCGDYVQQPGVFGVLSSSYYARNIDHEARTVVLTDSPDEAEGYFRGMRNVRIIRPDEATPLLAIKIISKAKTVISSNSTLSWWGAFFAYKNGSSVLMPTPFYKSSNHLGLMHPGFHYAQSEFRNS